MAAAFSTVLLPAMIRPFLSIRMERPNPYSRRERSMKAFPRSVPKFAFLLSGMSCEIRVIGFLAATAGMGWA